MYTWSNKQGMWVPPGGDNKMLKEIRRVIRREVLKQRTGKLEKTRRKGSLSCSYALK